MNRNQDCFRLVNPDRPVRSDLSRPPDTIQRITRLADSGHRNHARPARPIHAGPLPVPIRWHLE